MRRWKGREKIEREKTEKKNSPSKDFKQFTNSIEMFGFINKLQENVVDLFPNKSSQTEKLSIDSM